MQWPGFRRIHTVHAKFVLHDLLVIPFAPNGRGRREAIALAYVEMLENEHTLAQVHVKMHDGERAAKR